MTARVAMIHSCPERGGGSAACVGAVSCAVAFTVAVLMVAAAPAESGNCCGTASDYDTVCIEGFPDDEAGVVGGAVPGIGGWPQS